MRRFLFLFIFMASVPVFIFSSTFEKTGNNSRSADSTKVAYLNARASAVSNKNPDSSIWYSRKGLMITANYGDEYFASKTLQLYINMGVAYSIKTDYVKSIKYYLKAIDLLDTLISEYPQDKDYYKQAMAVCYTNIGVLYYLNKQYSLSIKNLKKTVPLLEKAGTPVQLGQLFNNIGVNYLAMKDYGKALEYYSKALIQFEKDSSQRDIAMVYSNMGEAYLFLKHRKKALNYLEKAIALKKALNDNYGLEVALYNVANLFFEEKNYSQAVLYGKQSLQIARQIDNQHDVIKNLELLSKSYAADKQYESAYFSLLELKKVSDSVFSEKKAKQLQELQTKYETKQKENEILLFKEKEKQHKLERKLIVTGSGLLAVIFVSVVLFLFYKRKHEKLILQKELEKKKINEEKLNKEITFKTKQLTTHALNMMQKNNMLNDLKKNLDKISTLAKPEIKENLSRLNRLIETNLKSEKDWEMFRIFFEQIDNGFYARLTKRYPNLNNNDLRHCALIKLNMNLKETAAVLNLSPNTVKSARNRLKKKLNLGPEDDLSAFIRNV